MIHRSSTVVVALLALLAVAVSARGDLVISIANLTGPTNGAGTFEVLLSSTEPAGGLDFDVTGFSFALSVPTGSGVQFTSASTATVSAPYLFDGTGIGSLDPAFTLSPDAFPNAGFGAADVEVVFAAITVHPGDVFGLGLVGYSVAPGASLGDVPISFDDAGTSLADSSGNAIAFTADSSDGVIRIEAVPEPNSLALTATALGTAALLRKAGRVMRRASRRTNGAL